MAQISPAQLAVTVCAFCFITQVLSQSTSPPNSTTLTVNQTANANITMATAANGVPANATTAPTGAGVQSQTNTFSLLIAVAMTTGLLHHWC